jgi:solute carrier family 25 carnitine/acylcarnitine transporter 20/29
LRGTLPDDGPRPEIIVPSAMFGGAIISFVLCPTELVKVKSPEHHFFPRNYHL